MDIKKLAPWNWFSREQTQGNVPVHTSPSDPFLQLHTDLENSFNNVMRNLGFLNSGLYATYTQSASALPTVDILSSDTEYVIRLEVPGVEEKDLKIELSADGALVVSGEKHQASEDKTRNAHRIERQYGGFCRVLSLPNDAEPDGIEAYFRNGVLSITCPRASTPDVACRRIEIKKVT